MSDRYRIEFESISAIRYPQLYDLRTERARQDIDRDLIPESWWTGTGRESEDEAGIRDQHAGLLKLIDEGEFIRNVRMLRSAAPEWGPLS